MSENSERQQKINELAERITELMFTLDIQFVTFSDEEMQLLYETKQSLRDKIRHNEAAFPMILALGGNYDSELDKLKLVCGYVFMYVRYSRLAVEAAEYRLTRKFKVTKNKYRKAA